MDEIDEEMKKTLAYVSRRMNYFASKLPKTRKKLIEAKDDTTRNAIGKKLKKESDVYIWYKNIFDTIFAGLGGKADEK